MVVFEGTSVPGYYLSLVLFQACIISGTKNHQRECKMNRFIKKLKILQTILFFYRTIEYVLFCSSSEDFFHFLK